MLRLQKKGEYYPYPKCHKGFGGLVRRLLWRLGIDPLTVYERLSQVEFERDHWFGLYMLTRTDLSEVELAARQKGYEMWRAESLEFLVSLSEQKSRG